MTIGSATVVALCIIALCTIIGGIYGTIGNATLNFEGGKWGFIVGAGIATLWIIAVVIFNSRTPVRRR
jgi:hypothetical protein